MKNYIILIFISILTLLTSCQQLVEPELSDINTLSSIDCIIVMEQKVTATGKPDDTRQVFAGSIAENGIITFSGISSLTLEQKSRAHFSAILPQTATIIEKDGAGNTIGNGIGGVRIVAKKTYYFYVIAANGAERKYTLSFN